MAQVEYTTLSTYLDSLAANTPDTPYEIQILNFNETTLENLRTLLIEKEKYVDLSSSVLSGLTTLNSGFTICNYLVEAPTYTNCTATSASYIYQKCKNLKHATLDMTGLPALISAFEECTSLESVVLTNTESILSLEKAFYLCTSLKSIELGNMKNVYNLKRAFCGCTSLPELDLTSFRVVTEAEGAISSCTKIKTIDLRGFAGVTSAESMLNSCFDLETIYNWTINFSNLTSYWQMLYGLPSLEHIYVSPVVNENADYSFWLLNQTDTGYNYQQRDLNNNTLASGSIADTSTNSIKLYHKTSDLLFAPSGTITEEKIATLLQTRYSWGTSGIDATNKNFIFWKDTNSELVSNIISDEVDVSNATGVLPVENGGTGATSLSSLTVGNANHAASASTCTGNSATATSASTCTGNSATATSASTCTGNSATATKLATARTVLTNLASNSSASFNGTANITPGVSGILPVANGGTGASSLSSITVGNATKWGLSLSSTPIDTGWRIGSSVVYAIFRTITYTDSTTVSVSQLVGKSILFFTGSYQYQNAWYPLAKTDESSCAYQPYFMADTSGGTIRLVMGSNYSGKSFTARVIIFYY